MPKDASSVPPSGSPLASLPRHAPLPPGLDTLLAPHLAIQSCPGPTPDSGPFLTISLAGLRLWADAEAFPLHRAMTAALSRDIWPLRFVKNRGWLTAAEQARLLESHALVAGCGGLGGHAALLLARAGVGEFTLCDHDVFSESNLNRQQSCREDRIGMNKAKAVAQDIAAAASHAAPHTRETPMTEDNVTALVRGANVALDCLDSIPARFILERAARRAGIPFIHAALAGQEGFTLIARPEQSPAMPRLYPGGEQAIPGDSAEARLGVPAATAAATAALQASAACVALLGRDTAKQILLHLDLSVPELNHLSLGPTDR